MVESVLFSIIPIISLLVGIYVGYKLRGNGGEDKLPDLKSPAKIIEEHKVRKEENRELEEVKKEIEETKQWIEEINNYNGEFGE